MRLTFSSGHPDSRSVALGLLLRPSAAEGSGVAVHLRPS